MIAPPVIGQVYHDVNYPEVAIIPLDTRPGEVCVIVGSLELIQALTPSDQIAASNWVRADFFHRSVQPS